MPPNSLHLRYKQECIVITNVIVIIIIITVRQRGKSCIQNMSFGARYENPQPELTSLRKAI